MRTVAIERLRGAYPEAAPFLQGRSYPELPSVPSTPNPVFDSVRQLLIDLNLDSAHLGSAQWNPLVDIVGAGQTVFIKPNMVDHEHRFGANRWSVLTHPSVVWAVAEYVALALRGWGRIIIGDNPHVDCHWHEIERLYRPDLLREHLRSRHGVGCDFVDLRTWHAPDLGNYGFKLGRNKLAGDPRGTVAVELGRESMLRGLPWWLFRGTYHERIDTILAHTLRRHRYVFSRSIFDADVFISVPKLKTHAKVGVTLNIKGLIGTIADKNALVHWRIGFPRFGGDEYPPPTASGDYARLYTQHLLAAVVPSWLYFHVRRRLGKTALGRLYRQTTLCEAQRLRMLRGAWDGNDTTWRMTADVYRAFVDNCTGRRRPMRFFSIVDGGMAGETDGPHFPGPRQSDILVAGEDLLAVDLATLRLMDFRLEEVRYLAHLAGLAGLAAADIHIESTSYDTAEFFSPERRHLGFRPPRRWPRLSLGGVVPGPSYLPFGNG